MGFQNLINKRYTRVLSKECSLHNSTTSILCHNLLESVPFYNINFYNINSYRIIVQTKKIIITHSYLHTRPKLLYKSIFACITELHNL